MDPIASHNHLPSAGIKKYIVGLVIKLSSESATLEVCWRWDIAEGGGGGGGGGEDNCWQVTAGPYYGLLDHTMV